MIAQIKHEYVRSCGAEDWYDHINGMSSSDVEDEMEKILIIYHNFLLKLYENTMYGDGKKYDKLKAYYYNSTNSNEFDESVKLLELLK